MLTWLKRLFEKRVKIAIRYKSGAIQTVTVQGIYATTNAKGELVKLTWDSMHPRPVFPNINQIESIWEINS